jgi:diguanylate cyclase (GGDEF)-like protein
MVLVVLAGLVMLFAAYMVVKAGADHYTSGLALSAGTALSLLLAALSGVLARSRNRAVEQVDQATTALRHDVARREAVEAQLRERETQLQQLAFRDPLTGLANRMLFYDRLTHALNTHARAGRPFAVLFIDLDGFKQINDDCGHQTGDAVLRAVATRLRAGLRAGDTVARFGGDEFVILLEGLTAHIDGGATAARIIGLVRQPIDVAGGTVVVSASVGIAVNLPGMGADDLLRQADEAMYTAKAAGKNCYAEATAG